MLIDEQFRKAAALLSVEITRLDGTIAASPAGTGFFVSMPLEGTAVLINYLVTARHVVVRSRPYGPLHVRLNVREEDLEAGTPGFEDAPIAPDSWIEHADTDVAISCIGGIAGPIDWRTIPIAMLASDEYIRQHRVGVGDEVFFVGLFSPLPGQDRFQPILRFGTISMMPHEKITIQIIPKENKEVDAYLVEARSWGGHSGSPAIIYYPPDREANSLAIGIPPALLGLVSGHIPLKNLDFGDSLSGPTQTVNSGIAVVIPAQAIIDLLMSKDAKAERLSRAAEVKRGRRPDVTLDSGSGAVEGPSRG